MFIPLSQNLARDDSNIEHILCLLLVQCFKDKVYAFKIVMSICL